MFVCSSEKRQKALLVVNVDDGLTGAIDPQDLEYFLEELKLEFKIFSKKTKYFLGFEIEKESGKIKIS